MNKTATLIFLLGINFIAWFNSWLFTGSEWQVRSGQRFDVYFTGITFIFQTLVCVTINFGPSSLGRFSVYLVSMVASCSMFIALMALQLFVALWRWASSCTGHPDMEQVYQNNKKVYYFYLLLSVVLAGGAGVLAVVIFSQHVASHGRDYRSLMVSLKRFLKICQEDKSISGALLLKQEIEAHQQLTPPYKILLHHFLENFLCIRTPDAPIGESYICKICSEPILPGDLRIDAPEFKNWHMNCFSAKMLGCVPNRYQTERLQADASTILSATHYINLLARLDPLSANIPEPVQAATQQEDEPLLEQHVQPEDDDGLLDMD